MKKVRLTGVPIDETNYGASSSESVMGEAEGYVIETSERGETRISAGLTIYVLIMLNPEDPDELQFEFESKDGRISLRGLVPILR